MAAKKKKTKAKSKAKAKPKAKAKSKVKKKTKARTKVSAIPKGYGTVTPSLVVNGAPATIEFCKAAFGAKLKGKVEGPNGIIIHAVLKIGDSLLHVGEAMDVFVSRSSVMLMVKDADKTYAQALAAGAKSIMPVDLAFWGDRYGVVQDPQGNQWEIGTHVKEVSKAEMKKGLEEMLIEMAKSGQRGG